MKINFLSLFICLALTGCSFIPKYNRPAAPIAPSWPGSAANQSIPASLTAAADIGWDKLSSDPRLNKLIELALNNNRDLRVAVLNVDLLRAQYRIGLARIIPGIDATGKDTQQRDFVKGEGLNSSKYSLEVGITSYELDLFGHVRSLKKQALENLFATEETRKSAQIALVAEVATQYFAERAFDAQLAQTQKTLESVDAYYKLIKSTYDIGNTSELDLRTAEAQVQTAKANVANYQRQHSQAENALVLLIGQLLPADLPPPQTFDAQKIVTDIPAGLPSDLITRRPDILAAEHKLKGANANIGAARAVFFPKITLTANGGVASAKLTDLFSGTSVWSFSPQISMPIFDGGANAASLDVAKISKSIEITHYEKAIQTAFREVADALTARDSYVAQMDAQQALVKALQQRYDLADVRYRNGVDNYLTVLTAQQNLYSAQQELIQAQLAQISNLVTLYKALGGGWENSMLNAKVVTPEKSVVIHHPQKLDPSLQEMIDKKKKRGKK